MALGNMRKDKKKFVPPAVQITSMMDMFTIIIIFLLFSFSSDPNQIQLDKDIRLPESTAQLEYKKGTKLVLTRTSLKLGDKTLATIEGDKVVGLNPDDLKASSLYSQLKMHRDEIQMKEKEGIDGVDGAKESPLYFLCDKRLSFKTINQVVKTAAMAGYPNFKFAVLNN